MSSSDPFKDDVAFEADVARLMSQAFELACETMQDSGYPDLIKEIVAKRIVLCASSGGSDPVSLCREALRSLGLCSDEEEHTGDQAAV